MMQDFILISSIDFLLMVAAIGQFVSSAMTLMVKYRSVLGRTGDSISSDILPAVCGTRCGLPTQSSDCFGY